MKDARINVSLYTDPYNRFFLTREANVNNADRDSSAANQPKAAITRVPFGLVGNTRLTTLSEAGTIDFVQQVLGQPAPQVLEWSSDLNKKNLVGTDFLTMEYLTDGTPLSRRWDTMSSAETSRIIREVLSQQIAMTGRPFSQIGSLYFKEDVSEELQKRPLFLNAEDNEHPLADRYRIGPIADKYFYFLGEEPLEGDRGPC